MADLTFYTAYKMIYRRIFDGRILIDGHFFDDPLHRACVNTNDRRRKFAPYVQIMQSSDKLPSVLAGEGKSRVARFFGRFS